MPTVQDILGERPSTLGAKPQTNALLGERPSTNALLGSRPPVAGEPSIINKPLADVPDWLGMKKPMEIGDDELGTMFQQPKSNMALAMSSAQTGGFAGAGAASMAAEMLYKGTALGGKDMQRAVYGGMYAATEQLSGLTSPMNLALIGGTVGLG